MLATFANFYAQQYMKHEPAGLWHHFPEKPTAPASDPCDAPDPEAEPEAELLSDGTQAASDNDFSEQDEAHAPHHPFMTRSQSGLAAAAQPNQGHSPSPNPKQRMCSVHHKICITQAREPDVTGALTLSLHPFALAVISPCSQTWPFIVVSARVGSTRHLPPKPLASAVFLRLPIHTGWSYVAVYVYVCMFQHINPMLDAAQTITCTKQIVPILLLANLHCFALVSPSKVQEIQKWQFILHVRRPHALEPPTCLLRPAAWASNQSQ